MLNPASIPSSDPAGSVPCTLYAPIRVQAIQPQANQSVAEASKITRYGPDVTVSASVNR